MRSELLKQRNGELVATPILIFQGTKKELPLNKTNLKMMQFLSGKESDKWIGQQIVLYAIPVPTGDGMREGIRIRGKSAVKSAPNGTAKPSVPAINPDDDVPDSWGADDSADNIPEEDDVFK